MMRLGHEASSLAAGPRICIDEFQNYSQSYKKHILQQV